MLDAPPDILVRAGGSALIAVVGVAAIALAKGRKGALALGAYLALLGVNLTFNNLERYDATVAAFWGPLDAFPEVSTAFAVLGMMLWWPGPLRREERRWLWVSLAAVGSLVLVALFTVVLVPGGWAAWIAAEGVTAPTLPLAILDYVGNRLYYGAVLAFSILLPLRFAATLPEESRTRQRLAVAAVAFGTITVQQTASLLQPLSLTQLAFNGAVFGMLLVVAPMWVYCTRFADGKLARYVAHTLLGLGLASLAVGSIDPASVNTLVGVERVLVAAAWTYGIARLGFLGYDLQVRTARRGTVAMAALAALFIVAQVAQEFLSAQYGLVMGGIVAGAFLFAAQPLQRAFEGRVRHREDEAPPPRGDSAVHDAVYKAAVRLALRGGIDPREEVELMRIADAHGISHLRAAALRREVEDEAARGGA